MLLKVFCIVLIGAYGIAAECDVGWAEFKEDCLWFSQSKRSWLSAEADCRKKGAYLASDDNEPKHDFLTMITNVLRDRGLKEWFIGGSDYTFEGQYRWLETGLHVGPFTRWAPGQPNGTSQENCMSMKWFGRDLLWVDEPCDNVRLHNHHTIPGTFYYICEKASNASKLGNSGLIG